MITAFATPAPLDADRARRRAGALPAPVAARAHAVARGAEGGARSRDARAAHGRRPARAPPARPPRGARRRAARARGDRDGGRRGPRASPRAPVRRRGMRPLVEATVADETGPMKATFFNQPWLVQQYPAGTRLVLHGKYEARNRFRVQAHARTSLADGRERGGRPLPGHRRPLLDPDPRAGAGARGRASRTCSSRCRRPLRVRERLPDRSAALRRRPLPRCRRRPRARAPAARLRRAAARPARAAPSPPAAARGGAIAPALDGSRGR